MYVMVGTAEQNRFVKKRIVNKVETRSIDVSAFSIPMNEFVNNEVEKTALKRQKGNKNKMYITII